MAQSTYSGPLRVGEGDAIGAVLLQQSVLLTQNSTTAVTGTVTLPANATIVEVYLDNLTVWDSATTAAGTVGTAAAGTQYATGLNAKTAGRQLPTYTSAQLTAMNDIGANTTVYFTITPTGATTAGSSKGVVRYRMN